MAIVKHHKVVAALPPELEANSIYYIRAATGFDVYVTNSAGTVIAYPANYARTDDTRLTDAREWAAATVTQAEAEAGTATIRRAWTAQRVFQAVAAWWAASAMKTKLDGIAAGATANATDAQLRDRATHTGSQAISTVSGLQAVLDGKINTTERGVSGGVATLDQFARIPASQLPSYVDDVLEYLTLSAFPATGETGKIYIAINQGTAANPTRQYRWTGSTYAEINPSPGTTDALAEGSTNLYFNESRVRNTVLTGLSLAVSTAVTATDTVLTALGKVQAKLNTLGTAAFQNLAALPSTVTITGASATALIIERVTAGATNLSIRFKTAVHDRYLGLNQNGDFAVSDTADLTGNAGKVFWHSGNFDPSLKVDTATAKGFPFINLMLDSGRFNGLIDPLNIFTDAAFDNVSNFLIPYNGSSIADAGEFIYNNNNNGGISGTMNADVVALTQAMGTSALRYAVEFHIATLTQGTGTNLPQSASNGATTYLSTVCNSQAIFSADAQTTFVGWIRAKSGTVTFSQAFYLNGEIKSGSFAITPAMGFVHIRTTAQNSTGYNNAWPNLRATIGAEIQIALPAFFNGLVDPGLHKSPIPTSPTLREVLKRLPESNPIATGLLTVAGASENLRLQCATGQASYATFYEGATRRGYVGKGSASTSNIYLSADAGNILLIPVAGSTILYNAGAAKLTTTTTGVAITGTFSATSDRKFKTSIRDHGVEEAWERLGKLQTRQFFYSLLGSDFTGWIAQEVEPIYPHSVGRVEDDDGGHLTLTKDEIIADLVVLVQEHQRRLTALEAHCDLTH